MLSELYNWIFKVTNNVINIHVKNLTKIIYEKKKTCNT